MIAEKRRFQTFSADVLVAVDVVFASAPFYLCNEDVNNLHIS